MASTALARSIKVLPGGAADSVVPLSLLGSGVRQVNNNNNDNNVASIKARQAPPPPSSSPSPLPALRIMPLGASVTFGIGSSTGNSYRKDLADLLLANGSFSNITYVGDFTNGDINSFASSSNRVEATPGFTLSQIADLARNATPTYRPNLILVDAGTNNCNSGTLVPADADADSFATEATRLVDDLLAASPGTTVLLAQLLVHKVAAQDACRVDVNRQYATLAAAAQAAGHKLVLVDMRGADGPTVADLADERHPNDVGYQKMANVWFRGIQQAVANGFISAPVDGGSEVAAVVGGEL